MMDRYLPNSSGRGWTILESSAIVQMFYTSLKNIPYAYLTPGENIAKLKDLYAKVSSGELTKIPGALGSVVQEVVSSFFQMVRSPEALESRVSYLEATLMAGVSTVHNLFFALLYTLLSSATLGFSKKLNFRCRLHWAHFTYGVVASGIGLVGVVSPFCGVALNLFHGFSLVRGFRKSYDHDVNLFERPLLQKIKEIVVKYRETIHAYTRAKVEDSRYVHFYRPSLWNIERRISVASRMDELYELIIDVRDQWPKVGVLEIQRSPLNTTKTGSPAAHDHYE